MIVNKATSLVEVASALPFRAAAVPFGEVAAHWSVVLNLLAGSLLGAWFGAGWATRLESATLYRLIALMLVSIAAAVVRPRSARGRALASGNLQLVAGVAAGCVIGVVASLLGVAGGELLIPTAVSRCWDKTAPSSSPWRSALSSGPSSADGCSAWRRAQFCSRCWPPSSSFPPSKYGGMDRAHLISLRSRIQHIEHRA